MKDRAHRAGLLAVRLVYPPALLHPVAVDLMDANFRPVFTDYAAFPCIPAALLAHGVRAEDVARVVVGNFLRVFGVVSRGRG